MQTIVSYLYRPTGGVTFRREQVNTPDGDFVDLDFADVEGKTWADLGNQAPIVLILHGLGGSAHSGYAFECYRQLARLGIRSVGLNYRSCSGRKNRTYQSYHAGFTTDLAFIIPLLTIRFPHVPFGLIGVSLGANMLLKYLGETEDVPVQATVAVSPPFDLAAGVKVLDFGSGRIYQRRFLYNLKQRIKARKDLLEMHVDMKRVLSAKTFHIFDDVYSAKLFGFKDAWDYYKQNSCGQFLPHIHTPTLLLRAIDDPLFDKEDIPWSIIEANPCLYNGLTPHGGHVGFVERLPPSRLSWWAERQATRFMAHHLL